MKTGAGLAVIAVGAILAFAVKSTPSGFNINIAGWVLMIVGIVGLLLPNRTYGWLGQRVVRRRYPTTNGAPQAPVQSYVAQNPGTSRLQPGLPAPRQVVVERPAAEVVEDVYEEPS